MTFKYVLPINCLSPINSLASYAESAHNANNRKLWKMDQVACMNGRVAGSWLDLLKVFDNLLNLCCRSTMRLDFFQGCSLLYIQWVKGGEHPKIVYTLSIDEFNADDHIELLFDAPVCKATSKGIDLELNADSGHDGLKHKIKIKVFHKFGKYSVDDRIIK